MSMMVWPPEVPKSEHRCAPRLFQACLAALYAPLVCGACLCNTSVMWDALSDLYEHTNGSGWADRRNWLLPNTTVCQWYGITCTSIRLRGNRLAGVLPSSLQHLSAISHFDVSGNALWGTLPAEYSAWGSSLLEFHVHENPLATTLPASYGNWSGIREFYVCSNYYLTGTLPESYSAWRDIRVLHLHNTKLGGTFSASYASWTEIIKFSIYAAAFTGPIPRYVANWSKIRDFHAQHNNFTAVEEHSASAASLETFDVSGNEHLFGTISLESVSLSIKTLNLCRTRVTITRNLTPLTAIDAAQLAFVTNCTAYENMFATPSASPGTRPVVNFPHVRQNTTVPPQSPPPTFDVQQAAADVGAVAVGVSSAVGMTMQLTNLAGGGMGALGSLQVSMGASRIAARVKKCSQSNAGGALTPVALRRLEAVEADESEIGGLVADSPLRLSLAAYRFPLTLGTVVGNVAMFALAPMAMALAAVAYWFVEYVWLRHTLMPWRALLSRSVLTHILSKKRERLLATTVGTFFSVLTILQTPTVGASVFLLMHAGGSDGSAGGVSGTDRAVSSAVGVLGLLVCTAPLVLMAFVYRARMPLRGRRIVPRGPARSATVQSSDTATVPLNADDASAPGKGPITATFSQEALDRHDWFETVLTFFTHRKTQWQAPPAAHPTVAAAALVFLLKPCAYPHSWQVFVDVGAGLLQGALNGVASFPFLSCDGVAAASWTLFVVCVALVLYAVILRGRNTNGEVVTQVLMFSLTSAAMLAAALGDQDSSNVVSLVQAALELVGCVPVLSVWKAVKRWCLPQRRFEKELQCRNQIISLAVPRSLQGLPSNDDEALSTCCGIGALLLRVPGNLLLQQRQRLRQVIQQICDRRASQQKKLLISLL